ncbi:hypothetical protein Q9K88_004669 [Escherichia coli]|nr:hypothetical protein [Escherichia coli]
MIANPVSSKFSNKRFVSLVHIGGRLFVVLVMLSSFYYAITSVFGKYFNPIMYFTSRVIGWILPDARMPVTYQEASNHLNLDGFYSVGDYGLALIYLVAMIYIQVFVITKIAIFISDKIEERFIIDVLGKKFHQRYCRANNIRLQKNELEENGKSALEKASRKHWEEWAKYNKSNMGYDEWISRVKKDL